MPYLSHEKLIVYQKAIEFVTWTEDLLKEVKRKTTARDHLERASCSIPVNLAEGNSKKSQRERSHYFEIASGSALECAACLDVLVAKNCVPKGQTASGKELLCSIVSMLVSLRSTKTAWCVKDGHGRYGGHLFGHEGLRVYQAALQFVSWCDRLMLGNEGKPDLKEDLDRSSTSIVLNIAEGNGKFSVKDRCRFLDIAHTSAVRCAATLDLWVACR